MKKEWIFDEVNGREAGCGKLPGVSGGRWENNDEAVKQS